LVRGKVKLVAANPGEGSRRGADFGRKVRECGDVIAVERDGVGELATGDLHAVTGVSCEANDRAVDNLALRFGQWDVGGCGHALVQVSPSENNELSGLLGNKRRAVWLNSEQVGTEANGQEPR